MLYWAYWTYYFGGVQTCAAPATSLLTNNGQLLTWPALLCINGKELLQ